MEFIVKNTISPLYNSLDATEQFLLVFENDCIALAKVSGDILGFKNREHLTFLKHPMKDVKNVRITEKMTKAIISWQYKNQDYSFQVDYKFPGIYKFNKDNFNYLKEHNFLRTGE